MDSQIDLQELIAKIKETAAACKTTAEARVLYDDAPYGSEAESIYEARWTELADAEAPAKAAACNTAAEARVLYDDAPYKSEARSIYETRWTELRLQELEA